MNVFTHQQEVGECTNVADVVRVGMVSAVHVEVHVHALFMRSLL